LRSGYAKNNCFRLRLSAYSELRVLAGDGDVLAEVVGLALDLNVVDQELLKSSDVQDLVGDRLRGVNGELAGRLLRLLALHGALLASSGLGLLGGGGLRLWGLGLEQQENEKRKKKVRKNGEKRQDESVPVASMPLKRAR